MSSDLLTVVQEVLDEVAPGAELAGVDPDADLRKVLDLDSLDFLNLVVGLDDRTGAQTPEQDYPRLTTLAGCLAYLGARQAAATGGGTQAEDA